MRRALTAVVIALVLTSFASVPIQAASPGQKCSKFGATAKDGKRSVYCVYIGNTLKWSIQKPAANSTPAKTPTQSINQKPPAGSLLMETVKLSDFNSEFYMNPRVSPEVAQSLQVTTPLRVSTVQLFLSTATYAVDPYWDLPNPANQVYSLLKRSGVIGAITTVTIWPVSAQEANAEQINLLTQAAPVYREVFYGDVTIGQPLALKFAKAVDLKPGRYLVTFGFELDDPSILTLRFQGRESGDSQNGPGGVPSPCDYKPAKDNYPAGKAFRGEGMVPYREGKRFYGGFGTVFTMHTAKVGSCTAIGKYGTPMNPGDMRLQLWGSKITTASTANTMSTSWGRSATATLPASAYAGLACDPFDPRLNGIPLPNGVGPEARAASACMMLDWLTHENQEPATVTITASPSASNKWVSMVRRSILAGDRLYGHYGATDRTYEFLLSAQAAFSCSTGKSLVDKRSAGRGAQFNAWEKDMNSGCAAGTYSPGAASAKILGDKGNIYFSWTLRLIPPGTSKTWDNWGHYLAFMTHEYVHSIQIDRSFGNPRGTERPGDWFSEGQAQFLAYNAVSLMQWPQNTRALALAELKADMKQAKVTSIKIEDAPRISRMGLTYSAGYFAHEYMVAHFGMKKLFDAWNIWNAPGCTANGPDKCWRELLPQALGVTDTELITAIDNYINAQLKG